MSFDYLPSSDQIGSLRRFWIILAALLVLGNYYYLYFVQFHQGRTSGEGIYGVLKLIGILLLSASISTAKIRFRLRVHEVFFLLFLVYSVISIAIKSMIWHDGDMMYFNMIVCAMPFLIIKFNRNAVFLFFETCLIVLSVEVMLDGVIYVMGYSLWNDKSFVGGLGNPSSFGFICDFFIAYILFARKAGLKSFIFLIFLSIGAVKSNAMLASLIYAGLLAIWGTRRFGIWVLIVGIVAGSGIVMFRADILSPHLIHKIDSIMALVSGDGSISSISVSHRVLLYQHLINELSENSFFVLFFGYPKLYYYAADSQYLTYIGSFGLFAAIIFFATISFCWLRSYVYRRKITLFPSVVILMFMLSFVTNRLLDYYPMAIFLFLALSLGATPTVRRENMLISDSQSENV